jgi:catechol 2,3-dioxygenase-like lactoylglutathione lyase family enzyme
MGAERPEVRRKTMEQRVSLITLGVVDMDASAAFYDAMGWKRVETDDGVVAYDLLGQTLGLYPLEMLAKDMGLDVAELGAGRATLGYNCREKADVAIVLAAAERAGARILKPAADVFWGGHHGYFADPDGHIWEVAHNPFSSLRESDGAFRWNGGYA